MFALAGRWVTEGPAKGANCMVQFVVVVDYLAGRPGCGVDWVHCQYMVCLGVLLAFNSVSRLEGSLSAASLLATVAVAAPANMHAVGWAHTLHSLAVPPAYLWGRGQAGQHLHRAKSGLQLSNTVANCC